MKLTTLFIITLTWLKIVVSPVLLGGIIGIIFYINLPGRIGILMVAVMPIIGFIIGAIWATKVIVKKKTSEYFSGLNSSPDLDNNTRNEKFCKTARMIKFVL